MQLAKPIPARHLHPVFAQMACTPQQTYGIQPTPPQPPELIRQLLDQHPTPPLGSADAI